MGEDGKKCDEHCGSQVVGWLISGLGDGEAEIGAEEFIGGQTRDFVSEHESDPRTAGKLKDPADGFLETQKRKIFSFF